MKKQNKIHLILLFLVLFLASFLRLYNLPLLSLFGDEVDVGYHAYSLLQTGKDYMGQFLPSYIHSLAEWRAPLLMYASIPSILIFSLTEWGVRITPAFFGILNVLLVFLLVRTIFKDSRWALLSALLLAINPWHLHYSRAAFEVTLLLSLFLAGVYFFIKGIKNNWYFLPSAIVLALTLYTYSTANVFLILLGLSLIVIYRKELSFVIKRKQIWISLIAFVLILIPIFGQLFSGRAGERFGLISVFSDQETIEEVHLLRLGGTFYGDVKVGLLEKVFINRPVYWSLNITKNYFSSFSPSFLFSSGDSYFRHSINRVGQFYIVESLFMLLGLFALFKIKGKEKWLIISWLLLAPIPSALTKDGGNHATRLFLMIPPLVILSALGLNKIIDWAKKIKIIKLILLLVCILLTFNFSFYLFNYFKHYPKESYLYWHYGYKQAMSAVVKHQDNYDLILINNSYEPALLRYLFWSKYPPRVFHQLFEDNKTKEDILPGFNGFKLENIYFVSPEGEYWWNNLDKNTLYLASAKNDVAGDWDWQKTPPRGIKVLEIIDNPLGGHIFYLVTHE